VGIEYEKCLCRRFVVGRGEYILTWKFRSDNKVGLAERLFTNSHVP
jgi:hypothetical protein